MKTLATVATAERHIRTGYRADVHPILVSYFAKEGLTDVEVARRLHINPSTLRDWRKKHPELAEAFHDSKELADARIEGALFRKALAGDVSACIFYLCNRRPDRWKRNGPEVEVQLIAKQTATLEQERRICELKDVLKSCLGESDAQMGQDTSSLEQPSVCSLGSHIAKPSP